MWLFAAHELTRAIQFPTLVVKLAYLPEFKTPFDHRHLRACLGSMGKSWPRGKAARSAQMFAQMLFADSGRELQVSRSTNKVRTGTRL